MVKNRLSRRERSERMTPAHGSDLYTVVTIIVIMAFVRRLRQGDRVYYARVETYREGGKVKQRFLEYLGTTPVRQHHPLTPGHARQVLADFFTRTLTPQVVRKLLATIGIEIGDQKVRLVGIEFDLRKKAWALRLR